MVLASFAEILSIGAVLPFLGVLSDPDSFLTNPYMIPVIEFLGISNSTELLLPLTATFSLLALFSGSVRLTLLWAQTRLSHSIGSDLSVSIYRRTLYQPYSIHLDRNTSVVIAGISRKTSLVVEQVLFPALLIMSSSLTLTAISAALVMIDFRIAFSAIIIFGVLYLIAATLTRKHLSRYSKRISIEQDQTIKALQEGLGGIRDVLIDGTQEAYTRVYRRADIPLRRALGNIQIVSVSPRYLIEVLGMILIAIMALTLTVESNGLVGAIPTLGAFALGVIRLLPIVQQVYQSVSLIRGGEASLLDVVGLLEQPLPKMALKEEPLPLTFQEGITFKDITFRYSEEFPMVLKGISFSIPKGSKVGVLGTTGSGKSTLLDILMGLLTPLGGSFLVDDVQIDRSNYRSWQAHIAHVPQSIFLSDSTIAENIAFGVSESEIDYERVKSACARAQIHDDIESWDLKYETPVGERGIRISGGQRQRIGIARALYKEATMIVLDEATSALDNSTEESVMEMISSIAADVTVVIVAHRLTTLRCCDFVVDLNDGLVSRRGSYADIIGASFSP